MSDEINRYNPFATNASGICAYCKSCYECSYLDYDDYSYQTDQGETEYECCESCTISDTDKKIYQPDDEALVWEKILENCTTNNDPLTKQVYDKYMEVLFTKID